MRNLASIQIIKELIPIEGADAIEIAAVLGWRVVVKKGEFKIGDKCIYCEIDSLMPNRPEFEFLKPRAMRIRTVRLRGQVSQGICFPLTLLSIDTKIEEGLDVTEILGITKYEAPIPASLSGKVKGSFPSFIPKSDETRVQVLQTVLDKYNGITCYVTEKLDGSSVTYFIKNGEFGVCSRNLELLETEENTFWKVARQLDIENKLRTLNRNCAIQGELIGENVQSNKYKLRGQTVKFFNFFDIDKRQYVSFSEFKQLFKKLDLDIVPIIDENYSLTNDIESLVKTSVAKSVLNLEAWREGIVIRPLTETIDYIASGGLLHNDRLSFKVINPEFLLKYGE
ncbi:MAG: RNA ligase [Bacteroidetes bacterium GWA2_30_7]|nr:MAG: RNA ligase [Bacteroidetes bacterium GWA2_30_7]